MVGVVCPAGLGLHRDRAHDLVVDHERHAEPGVETRIVVLVAVHVATKLVLHVPEQEGRPVLHDPTGQTGADRRGDLAVADAILVKQLVLQKNTG